MRYSFLVYKKDPINENDPGKTIGVFVQDDKAWFKFTKDPNKLRAYDPSVDLFIVQNLGKTIQSLIEAKTSYVSGAKPGTQTSTSEREFLEELRGSYQGKVQFSKVIETNDPKPREVLEELYTKFVEQ